MATLLIKENIPLKDLTTFHVGGYAKYFAEVDNKEELTEAVNYAKSKKIPIFVLGGGSDILMSDDGFNGLVLRYKDSSVYFNKNNEYTLVTAAAGLVWDNLVKMTVNKKLQGIECLSGIPGSVGAAPIQNIGAYGQELKDTFIKLTAYDTKTGEFITLENKDCKFSYRDSMFKDPANKSRYVILNITLKLNDRAKPSLTYESLTSYLKNKKISDPTVSDVREAVLDIRGQKLDDPGVIGNAGSFFKNPIVGKKVLEKIKEKYTDVPYHQTENGTIKLYAGWLIEKAGWKGKSYKNASVSGKNALVIINPKGRASAKEVKELADRISEDVFKKFEVKLEPEVQYIGF